MYATNNFNKLCRKEKKGSLRIDRKSHIYRLVECIWQEQKRKKTILCCQVHIPSDCNRLSSSLQSNCCIWIRNIGFLVHSFINMKISFFGMLLGTGVFWSTRQVSIDRFAYLSTAISYVSLLHTILYDVIPKKTRLMLQRKRTARLWLSAEELEFCCCSTQFNSTPLNSLKWVVWMKADGGEREMQTQHSIVHETILKIPMLYERKKNNNSNNGLSKRVQLLWLRDVR